MSPESHFLYAQRSTITVKVAYYLHNVQQEESMSCTLEGKWPSYNIYLKLPYTLLFLKTFWSVKVYFQRKKISFPVESAWHFPYHCDNRAGKERVHTSIKKELILKKATSLYLRFRVQECHFQEIKWSYFPESKKHGTVQIQTWCKQCAHEILDIVKIHVNCN